MPKLKEYTETSKQSGFYILSNVGGSHPITLQVTDIGQRILRNADYEPERNIPNNVVWSLYDVGILYTNQPLDEQPDVTGRTNEIFHQLNIINKLTSDELDQLLVHLKDYSGPNEAQVESLRTELQDEQATSRRSSSEDEYEEPDAERAGTTSGGGDVDHPRTFWGYIKFLLKPPNLFSHGILPGLIVWFLWFPVGLGVAMIAISLYVPYRVAVHVLAEEDAPDSE